MFMAQVIPARLLTQQRLLLLGNKPTQLRELIHGLPLRVSLLFLLLLLVAGALMGTHQLPVADFLVVEAVRWRTVTTSL
jgi:hypothetical protein